MNGQLVNVILKIKEGLYSGKGEGENLPYDWIGHVQTDTLEMTLQSKQWNNREGAQDKELGGCVAHWELQKLQFHRDQIIQTFNFDKAEFI